MGNSITKSLLLVGAVVLVSGCANFRDLKGDLGNLQEEKVPVNVIITDTTGDENPIALLFYRVEDQKVLSFRFINGSGPAPTMRDREASSLFAFVDLNTDLNYQDGEPYGWYDDGAVVDLTT